MFIDFENVTVSYKDKSGNENVVLEDVNLSIDKGEFICLLGPSGCGKSTLLNAAAGFEKVSKGTVKIDEKVVEKPSLKYITIFQNYGLFPWRSVLKNVEFGLEKMKVPKEKREEIAMKNIELVGLKGSEHKHPAEAFRRNEAESFNCQSFCCKILTYYLWMSRLVHLMP